MDPKFRLKKSTKQFSADCEAAQRLNAILNGSVFAIVTIDDVGVIEEFNSAAERLFGYSATEVVGKNVKILMPEPYKSEHDRYLENFLATGIGKIIGTGRRVVGRRKSGKEFPLHLTVSEVHARDRRIFTGMIYDISREVNAEHNVDALRDQLHHVARVSAMGELASSLAHEINQPLTAIANFVSAARRILENNTRGSAEKATDYMLQAGDEALRAGEIIRRLRSFIETGETERLPDDLVSTIKEAAQLSLVGNRAASIKLSWNIEADLPLVLMDRIQIQQVFQNLIRNAVDALIEEAGDRHIAIQIKRSGANKILASVEDNGPGLDPTLKDVLFTPFVTSKKNGMGIGLSISRNIIEAHGGKIYFEEPDGGGTRFCVTLPVPAANGKNDA